MNDKSVTVVPAAIAQLGERQTEDLKVPGSIPGHGMFMFAGSFTFLMVLDNVCDVLRY